MKAKLGKRKKHKNMRDKEIWKDFLLDSKYQISNKGRVKSKSRRIGFNHSKTGDRFYRTTKEIILKNSICKGYQFVRLRFGNVSHSYRICRLVALHFLDNIDEKGQVNHKDGDKMNDNLDNLEWVTASENMKHAYKMGLAKSLYKLAKDRQIKVKCTITGRVYESIKDFAKHKNVDDSVVSRALSSKYNDKYSVEYYDKNEKV